MNYFNRAVAPQYSFASALIENVREYSSVTQYVAQAVTSQLKNSRNLHEIQRLAKILDAMSEDGLSPMSKSFECTCRMFFGLTIADDSGDWSVVDVLLGSQKSQLPVEVINAINKSRLANQKINRKSLVDQSYNSINQGNSNGARSYFGNSNRGSFGNSMRARGNSFARGGRAGYNRGGRGGYNNYTNTGGNSNNNGNVTGTGGTKASSASATNTS